VGRSTHSAPCRGGHSAQDFAFVRQYLHPKLPTVGNHDARIPFVTAMNGFTGTVKPMLPAYRTGV